ncbi:dynein regulatory complex subunit 2-like isoform X1 [Rhodnius prolixus]|uniref:dynein regulatory complex subunit 2-like isoform X1 n=1 Tax=Rhodnius prolixus TaxID=13249 RepID=UPI003D18DC37
MDSSTTTETTNALLSTHTELTTTTTPTTTKTTISKKEKKRREQQEYRTRQRQFDFRREVALSRVTHEKLKERLEKLLKKKYIRLIYGDAMHQWKLFLCSVTTKDKYIQSLLEEIEHIRTSRKVIKQIQLGFVDEIICIFNHQLKYLSANYARKKEGFFRDRCHFIKALETRTDLKLSKMYKIQRKMAKASEEQIEGIESRGNYYHTMMLEETEKIKQDVEKSVNAEIMALWEEYSSIISKYTNETYDLRLDLIVLTDKETATRHILDNLSKKIMNVEVQIKTYTDSCVNCKLQKLVAHYQPERDLYCNVTKVMRDKIREFNNIDEKKITFLSSVSNKAIKTLKDNFDKIQTLIRYMSISQRFETEEEKTLTTENDCEAYFPNLQELQHYKIMHQMYCRRSRIAIYTEFLQKVYDEEKEEMFKLKRLIENVINNFDIMQPEVIAENEICIKNIENT